MHRYKFDLSMTSFVPCTYVSLACEELHVFFWVLMYGLAWAPHTSVSLTWAWLLLLPRSLLWLCCLLIKPWDAVDNLLLQASDLNLFTHQYFWILVRNDLTAFPGFPYTGPDANVAILRKKWPNSSCVTSLSSYITEMIPDIKVQFLFVDHCKIINILHTDTA